MEAFYVGCTVLAAVACGAVLVFGGVRGALSFLRIRVDELDARLETVERQIARRNGQVGQDRKVARAATEAERLAEALAASAGPLARGRAPVQQNLRILDDGTVVVPPIELAAARKLADGGK